MLRYLPLLLSFGTVVNAQTVFYSSQNNAADRDIYDFRNYMHHVVDYYEGSPRQLVDKMSAQDQNKYAATGSFHCDGVNLGTAQLTLVNNIITTAAHSLTDRETCAKKHDPSHCIIKLKFNGNSMDVPVERSLASGFVCPPPNGKLPLKSYRDWEVLKLKFPVEGVAPYQIDAEKVQKLTRGERVITIGHSEDFHGKIVNKKWVLPKHYGTCSIMNVDRYETGASEPYYLATGCGCGGGCSGGTLMSDDNKPTLLGIFGGNWETADQVERGHSSSITLKWNLNSASSFYVPVTGDFLKAVEDAAGLGSI